ncbi:DUF2267 domain-containing protein [Rhodohalobacter sp. 8-1]|uniref:DUF2267 domain-containing protein n=1 Tax=Rhodohalobacter sp. 8-1 TaxID=3131972 RepID=UPI0030EB8267
MKFLKNYFFDNKQAGAKKKRVLESIKNNLENFNHQNISISECLNKTGELTADLIVYQNTDVYIPQKVYNAISNMATNYYVLLYMVDIHTSFYVLNKKNVYDQIVELMEEILEEETAGDTISLSVDSGEPMYSVYDFSKELVDVYYLDGYEGCLQLLASSVYSVIKSVNENPELDKGKIEQIFRELPDRTLFTQLKGNEISQFLNYTTSKELPVKIHAADVDTTLDVIHNWVGEIVNNMSSPLRKDVGYKVLSAVLHTLRDELDLQEIFRFSDQLPCSIRGVFFEGYDPEKVPVLMYNKTFLDSYHSRMGPGNSRHLEHHLLNNHHHSIDIREFMRSVDTKIGSEVDIKPEVAVEAVLKVLRDKTSVMDLNIDKVERLMNETVAVSAHQQLN